MIAFWSIWILKYAHGLGHAYGHASYHPIAGRVIGIAATLVPVHLDEWFDYGCSTSRSTAGIAACGSGCLFPSCMAAAVKSCVVANLPAIDIEHVLYVLGLSFGLESSFGIIT